ncbi:MULTISPECIES: hypothetical protein [unclassified Streptomyces]|jgi:hypothetical protein|uniref:hypothetical protein n=1 Tax=unclassified Streptomyces TaxID=2593676 RepID=UPI0029A643E3|nr:hypothetical protein [Streptomyces sp. PA03-2a]MDX2732867.1 hypothetical protein [Streptomyces sp. PA03-2a]
MRTRTATIAIAATLLLGGLAGCGYTADDCAAAINDSSTKTNRPKECKDISDEDYMTLVLGYMLKKQGLDNVDEHPEDLLDYAEDGVVDGN